MQNIFLPFTIILQMTASYKDKLFTISKIIYLFFCQSVHCLLVCLSDNFFICLLLCFLTCEFHGYCRNKPNNNPCYDNSLTRTFQVNLLLEMYKNKCTLDLPCRIRGSGRRLIGYRSDPRKKAGSDIRKKNPDQDPPVKIHPIFCS